MFYYKGRWFMSKKKNTVIELRYYEKPIKEPVLAMLGESWIREYGKDTNGEMINNLHFHNLMEIGCCISGEGEMILDGESKKYKAGNFTIIPINFPHNTVSKKGTKSYWEYIFCDPEDILNRAFPNNRPFVESTLKRLNSKVYFCHSEKEPELYSVIKSIFEEMRNKKAYYCEKTIMLCNSLFFEVARKNTSDTSAETEYRDMSVISAAISYIGKNYAKPIRIKDVADRCNMSETNFRRLFSAYMGRTPLEYFNLIRINKACELIKSTLYSMEDIAMKVGYSQMSTFNRNFKKIIGESPYRWKRNPANFESKLLKASVSTKKGW